MVTTQNPASASHDLLIVQRAEPMQARVLDQLQRKGFAIRVVSDPAQSLEAIGQLADPIIVVECGNKPGSHEYMQQFVQQSQFHEFPVLVLGRDIEGLEEQLRRYFGFVTTLRTPCSPADIFEAIRYIARAYRRGAAAAPQPEVSVPPPAPPERARRRLRERPERAPAAGPEPARELEEDEPLPAEKSHALYHQAESIPNLLFQQIQQLSLSERALGGATYPRYIREESLDIDMLLPDNERARAACVKMLNEVGRWGAMHLYRSSYILNAILTGINMRSVPADTARAAVFLFAYSFGRRNRSFLRREYFGRGTVVLRKELCSLIKDSALQLSMEAQLPEVAALVATLGRLIGRELQVNDEEGVVLASAIMAADFADRLCYQSGYWNPRAAYLLVQRIKSSRMKDFHPAVLCCLVKFLSESITGTHPAHLLSKQIRDNPELREQARRTREEAVRNDEAKISLSSLAPGMKLSRPLVAFDGRQILSEDLTLDQDLIWRIWQLSAVRPLNGPVIVIAAPSVAGQEPSGRGEGSAQGETAAQPSETGTQQSPGAPDQDKQLH